MLIRRFVLLCLSLLLIALPARVNASSQSPVPANALEDHRWSHFFQSYYGQGTEAPEPQPPPAQPGPAPAPADADAASYERLAQKITTQAGVLAGVRDPSLTSNLDSGEPSVVLLASNDGVTARARMGYLITGRSLADITFTGPIKSGEAVLFDRQGLGNKASLEARYTFVPWKKTTMRDARGVSSRLRAGDTSLGQVVADALQEAQANERLRLTEPGVGRAPFRGTVPSDSDNMRRAFSDVWRRKVLGTGKVQVHSAALFSATYTTGANSLPYLDPATFETKPFSSRSEALAGTFGWMQAQGASFSEGIPRVYVGFSVEGSRSYQPQTARNICRPVAGTSVSECLTLSVGEPSSDHVLSYQGEGRVWLKARTLAVGARVTYEEQRKTETKQPTRLIEFPFYFLKKVAKVDELPKAGETPPFTGGVNLGWRSETGKRNFFMLLFVGSTFSLPGLP